MTVAGAACSVALAAAKSRANDGADVLGANEAGVPDTAGVAETGGGTFGTLIGVGRFDMFLYLFNYFVTGCGGKNITLDCGKDYRVQRIEGEEAVELAVPLVLHGFD